MDGHMPKRQSEDRRRVRIEMGERLTRRLAELGKGVSDLQHACQVSWPAAQAWVQGRSYPDGTYLAAIAKELGMTVEELVGIARGEEPAYGAWPVFVATQKDMTQDERDALALMHWVKEPSLSSYVLALAALRA